MNASARAAPLCNKPVNFTVRELASQVDGCQVDEATLCAHCELDAVSMTELSTSRAVNLTLSLSQVDHAPRRVKSTQSKA